MGKKVSADEDFEARCVSKIIAYWAPYGKRARVSYDKGCPRLDFTSVYRPPVSESVCTMSAKVTS